MSSTVPPMADSTVPPSSGSRAGKGAAREQIFDSLAAPEAPEIDSLTRNSATALLMARQVVYSLVLPLMKQHGDVPVDTDEMKQPFDAVEQRFVIPRLLKASQGRETPEVIDVPRFRAEDITPAELQALVRLTPVVLEGFARDSDAVRKWNLAYLREHYGEAQVWVNRTDLTERKESLRNILDEILDGKVTGRYVLAAADIFNHYPELERALPIDRMIPLVGSLARHFGTELFLGGANTGSPFHCAPHFNFFVMVHGVKEWQFAHPSFSPWMYACLHPTGLAAGSPIRHRLPPDELDARFPLFKYIARQKARLEPGDVLLNPPWWWHAVDNLTPSTIAVATRWVEPRLSRFNAMFELTSLLSRPARVLFKEMRERKGRLTDALAREHYHRKLRPRGSRS